MITADFTGFPWLLLVIFHQLPGHLTLSFALSSITSKVVYYLVYENKYRDLFRAGTCNVVFSPLYLHGKRIKWSLSERDSDQSIFHPPAYLLFLLYIVIIYSYSSVYLTFQLIVNQSMNRINNIHYFTGYLLKIWFWDRGPQERSSGFLFLL